MSNIPHISHRMFVAAVAQERRQATASHEDLPWDENSSASLEVLDLPTWQNSPLADEPLPPFEPADHGL